MIKCNQLFSCSDTGLQIQCSSEFIVGQSVTCNCTSDLDPLFMEWYFQGNGSVLQRSRTSITIPVTTDDEGSVYTCRATSSCGTQQKIMILNTTGMLY